MKKTQTVFGLKPLSWIIIFLVALIIGAVSLVMILRGHHRERINVALSILQDNRRPIKQAEETIELLYGSEVDLEEFTLLHKKTFLRKYRGDIIALKAHLDSLINMISKVDAIAEQGENSRAIEVHRITLLSDSLMGMMSNLKTSSLSNGEKQLALHPFVLTNNEVKQDSMVAARMEGITDPRQSTLGGKEMYDFAGILVDRENDFYKNQVNNLIKNQKAQKTADQELIHVNISLMSEIERLLEDMQMGFMEEEIQSRTESAASIAQSTAMVHNILLFAIIGILLLALVIIYMLVKISRDNEVIKLSEKKALKETDEKSRFLAYMSHEFRSPVSLVLGYTEQLEHTSLTDEQTKYLQCLKDSSRLLQTTVNDVLDLSALEAGKLALIKKPFFPEDLIKKTVETFTGTATQKGLSLICNLSQENVCVKGDEIRLQQVVTNLLSNAIKYTDTGGVTVSSSFATVDGQAQFQFTIADTGIGIAADKVGQIFDEYQRVHDSSASHWIIGTGLGLPITRLLIQQMGGNISVSSRLNEGTEMSVTILYTRILDEEKIQHTANKSTVLPQNLKVLIADDDELNIYLLRVIFEKEKINFDVAENGVVALEKLTAEPFSLLLTDRYMLEMDGITLAEEIRKQADERLRKMPIILLSGHNSPEIAMEIEKGTLTDSLMKSYKREQLLALVYKYATRDV